MWCLGTWFSGGLGSVRLTVGLDLKGLFQPKDSVILFGGLQMGVMLQPYGHGYRLLAGSNLEACQCSGAVKRKALVYPTSPHVFWLIWVTQALLCSPGFPPHPAVCGVS